MHAEPRARAMFVYVCIARITHDLLLVYVRVPAAAAAIIAAANTHTRERRMHQENAATATTEKIINRTSDVRKRPPNRTVEQTSIRAPYPRSPFACIRYV